MRKTILWHLALIYGLFIICAAIGMIIYPGSFDKFFATSQLRPSLTINPPNIGYYWDVEHYATMAVSNTCSAFYPLWPWLIKYFFHPKTVVEAAYQFKTVGAVIFSIVIIPLYILFSRIFKSSRITLLMLLAFVLSPTGILRVLGYTESLYCLFAIFFIWSLHRFQYRTSNPNIYYATAFVSTIAMCLTRPNSLQLVSSVVATSIAIIGLRFYNTQGKSFRSICKEFIPELKMSGFIAAASVIGYSIYGWTCWQIRGDFFAPFHDQSQWGRKIGFYPDLLFVRGSMFDLMGLYMPIIILVVSITSILMKDRFQAILNTMPHSPIANVWLLYPPIFIPFSAIRLKLKSKQIKQEWQLLNSDNSNNSYELESNYLFWFSTFFAVITSIIVFLCPTNFGLASLASLGRYIFAVPFFYISLGYLCIHLQNSKVTRSLYYWIAISIIALIEQWVNYGKDLWLS